MAQRRRDKDERQAEARGLRGRRMWPEDVGKPREDIVFEEPVSAQEDGWTRGTGGVSHQELEAWAHRMKQTWRERQAQSHE